MCVKTLISSVADMRISRKGGRAVASAEDARERRRRRERERRPMRTCKL